MHALLKSGKLVAVILALGWAGFAIYLGSIANYDRIVIEDAFVQANGRAARSASVSMLIRNNTQIADRLIAVVTDAARAAELHSPVRGADGVMVMRRTEGGFELPVGAELALDRDSNHVMLFGLRQALGHGDEIILTLVFEVAGEISMYMLVDLDR